MCWRSSKSLSHCLSGWPHLWLSTAGPGVVRARVCWKRQQHECCQAAPSQHGLAPASGMEPNIFNHTTDTCAAAAVHTVGAAFSQPLDHTMAIEARSRWSQANSSFCSSRCCWDLLCQVASSSSLQQSGAEWQW